MRRFVLLLLLMVCPVAAYTQSFIRGEGEGAEQFAARAAPEKAILAHQVIETGEWGFSGKAIIAFYEQGQSCPPPYQKEDCTLVTGFLLVPEGAATYRRLQIDKYEQEGSVAQVDAVFFAGVGNDPVRKLAVLVSWHSKHGDIYRTFIYGRPSDPSGGNQLPFLEQLSTNVDGGCIYCRKRPISAAEVRATLKRAVSTPP